MKSAVVLFLIVVSFLLPALPACAQSWQAGASVEEAAVLARGVERCFTAEELPDSIWHAMQGKSYVPNPHIQRRDLRYLTVLHTDSEGVIHVGELVCHRRIATLLLDIFRQLYDARYPIGRMRLPEVYDADDERQMRANNTSCFCYRPVAGSRKLSKHAMGLAVDVNPLYNPYVKSLANGKRRIQPANAEKYCNRKGTFPYKIVRGDACHRLFTQNGFLWGGAWRSLKDYQHFELP